MRAGHLGHSDIGEYGYRAGIELVQGETTDSIATIISAGAECTVEQLLDLDQHLLFWCPPANWQRTDWETLRQLGQRRRVMIGFLDRWKSRNK